MGELIEGAVVDAPDIGDQAKGLHAALRRGERDKPEQQSKQICIFS